MAIKYFIKLKPKILGVTLARGGSKSIPQKNIIEIANYPLIYYTIKEAKLSQYIDRYIVSTDSLEISEVAKKLGAEVPFIRPLEYSTDTATSAVALRHAVLFCEKQEKCKYDYVVELMATNPFKKVNHIDEVIKNILKRGLILLLVFANYMIIILQELRKLKMTS